MLMPNIASWSARGFHHLVRVNSCNKIINKFDVMLFYILESKTKLD